MDDLTPWKQVGQVIAVLSFGALWTRTEACRRWNPNQSL